MNNRHTQLVMLLIALTAMNTQTVWAITGDLIDDFENGTVQGWLHGRTSRNAPRNIGSGGNPGSFLQVGSTGAGGAASRLVMFNRSQWTGNYQDVGVSSIELDLMNIDGTSSLPMRIAIQGSGNTQFGSTDAFTLPADNQWHTASFGLSADDLALISGSASLDAVLSDVTTVRVLSATGGPAWRGDIVAAQLGVDNITAVSAVAGPALQAGDADQDLDFDQLDLVQVQVAAKYLTGQPATWGDGDWNGAPGGGPGDPPAGDGLFNQFDIIAAQQAGIYLTGPYAALFDDGQRGDAQTSVVYDAGTGELSVDAPLGTELTSINIDSAAGIFTGTPADSLGGSFDNDTDTNIFKATFGNSFGSIHFGAVAEPGLDEALVRGDLTVVESLAGGGGLGDVDLVYVPVPEPTGLVLLFVGFAALGVRGRRYGRGQWASSRSRGHSIDGHTMAK